MESEAREGGGRCVTQIEGKRKREREIEIEKDSGDAD